jgi:hypothetical protein
MAKGDKIKKTKGGQKTPEKAEPLKETGPPTNGDSHLENPSNERPIEEVEPSANVAAMLQGKGFEIEGHAIRNTDGLSAASRATIVDKLTDDQQAICRTCIVRLRQTFAKIELVVAFGRWLTDNYAQSVHVRLPVSAYYDIKDSRPMNTLQIRKSNITMWIRDDLKCQIQNVIEGNSEYVSCTDIDRLLMMVE